ncbi:MAG TPA: hypothetical protein VF661_16995 [Actinomycetales bacterium]|jgi:hypothetical protein
MQPVLFAPPRPMSRRRRRWLLVAVTVATALVTAASGVAHQWLGVGRTMCSAAMSLESGARGAPSHAAAFDDWLGPRSSSTPGWGWFFEPRSDGRVVYVNLSRSVEISQMPNREWHVTTVEGPC